MITDKNISICFIVKKIKCAMKSNSFIIRDERIAKGKWCVGLTNVQIYDRKGIEQSRLLSSKNHNLTTKENALFLIHKGELAVFFCGVILSLQECYLVFANNELELKGNICYNFLNNFGYRLFRHLIPNSSERNKRLTPTNVENQNYKELKNTVETLPKSEKILIDVSNFMSENKLWKGSTKPLITSQYSSIHSFLSQCMLTCELNRHNKSEEYCNDYKFRSLFDKLNFSIKVANKLKSKSDETFDQLHIIDRHENFTFKHLCFCQENESVLIGVDAETEYKFFRYSSVSCNPKV